MVNTAGTSKLKSAMRVINNVRWLSARWINDEDDEGWAL